MLSRGGAPGQAGAVLALLLLTAGVVAAAGAAGLELAALAASDQRAAAAADAAAHAAETELAGDHHLVELSVAAQANRQACLLDPSGPTDGSQDELCQPVVAAARNAATANRAELTYFRVGPSLADRLTTRGAGRLTALVRVALRRRSVPTGPWCPAAPPAEPTGCWAVAWSAAQLS